MFRKAYCATTPCFLPSSPKSFRLLPRSWKLAIQNLQRNTHLSVAVFLPVLSQERLGMLCIARLLRCRGLESLWVLRHTPRPSRGHDAVDDMRMRMSELARDTTINLRREYVEVCTRGESTIEARVLIFRQVLRRERCLDSILMHQHEIE